MINNNTKIKQSIENKVSELIVTDNFSAIVSTIKNKVAELEERIEGRKPILTIGNGETSVDDIGTAYEMQSNSRNESEQDTLYLKELKRALVKIEEDDYGYCGGCGEDIDIKRLLAYPAALNCIDCQTDLDLEAA